MYKRLNVPYTYPPINFLTLQDYIKSLSYVAYWPFDDAVNNPFHRVINPAVAKGRQLALTPDFVTDTNWTKGAGWTISGGVAVGAAVSGNLSQSILQAGRAYEIIFDVVVTTGSMRVIANGTLGTTRSVSGTYTENLISTGTSLIFASVSTFTGTIDNVSVKEINIPASDAVPIQLLNTDVWNGLGTAAWTATAGATLSMQTTTRHDGVSGTVLRVTRNGTNNPTAQTPVQFTVGQIYRIFGWARSGGTVIWRIDDTTGGSVLNGTASTDWQPFDFLWIATTTAIRLRSSATIDGQYAEFDVTVVALDTGIRQGTVIVDGDQELSGVGMYPVLGGATLTKSAASPHSGSQALRCTSTGTVNSGANLTSALVVGKRYRLTGWYRGDGSVGIPAFRTSGVVLSTGTISATWVQVDLVFIAADAQFRLVNSVATAAGWVEFDDITVTEISPLAALPVNGAVLGNVESNRLLESVAYDGVNDLSNLYSTQLNSVFTPSALTVSLFFKISGTFWTDGATHYLFSLNGTSSNDQVLIRKSASNNTLIFSWRGNNILSAVTFVTVGQTGWCHAAITVDIAADQVKAYFNGVQVGATLTGLTAWTSSGSNLLSTACVLAALNTSAANPSPVNLSNVAIFSQAYAAEYIAEIAKLGDTF